LRPDGYTDLQGRGVISTIDGNEKASYTYMAIGQMEYSEIMELYFSTQTLLVSSLVLMAL